MVDALNATGAGFNFNQDTVLKSGLVLAGISDIGFKVKNFTAQSMATLDKNWDAITDSLKVAAGLLSDFGLSSATLTATSVLIPIAYYVHRRGLDAAYRSAPSAAADRSALRTWTLRSLVVRGIWGSADSLLRDLRQVIVDHGAAGFPVDAIERRMAARGKSLALNEEQIDDLVNLTYGAPRTFAVLALLFPYVNTRNGHHVDHIFPQALLSGAQLKKAELDRGTIDSFSAMRDRCPTCSEGPENIAKSATSPALWVDNIYGADDNGRRAYLDRNELDELPADVTEFAASSSPAARLWRCASKRRLVDAGLAEVALTE